jgi:hypothetical protein
LWIDESLPIGNGGVREGRRDETMIGLEQYLSVAAALFVIGMFFNRKTVPAEMWCVPAKAMELTEVKPGQGL